jgi:hypothetical protein
MFVGGQHSYYYVLIDNDFKRGRKKETEINKEGR